MPCGGELRSTAIVQERGGRTTVLNEPGPAVDERRWARLRERGARPAGRAAACSCARAACRRAPARRLRAPGRARPRRGGAQHRRRCGRDAAARARRDARPRDAEPRRGRERARARQRRARRWRAATDARPRALAAAEALLRQGARAAVVTADAAGAAVAADGEARVDRGAARRRGAQPDRRGRRAASALAAALERGEPLIDAARAGVAAAAASVESPDRGRARPGAGSGVGGGDGARPVARPNVNGGWVGKGFGRDRHFSRFEADPRRRRKLCR